MCVFNFTFHDEIHFSLNNYFFLSLKTLVTNYEIDVKRTTIEQLRASPVQLPNSQPGSPKLDEISSKIRQLHEDVDNLNKDTTRKLCVGDISLLTQLTELMKVGN